MKNENLKTDPFPFYFYFFNFREGRGGHEPTLLREREKKEVGGGERGGRESGQATKGGEGGGREYGQATNT
jgi:hypothetical protein